MMLFEQGDGTYQIRLSDISDTAVPWVLAVDGGALRVASLQVHKFSKLEIVQNMDNINAAVDMARSAVGECGKPLKRLLTLANPSPKAQHPVPTLITKLKEVLHEKTVELATAIAAMHESSLGDGKAVVDAGEVSVGGESGWGRVFPPSCG